MLWRDVQRIERVVDVIQSVLWLIRVRSGELQVLPGLLVVAIEAVLIAVRVQGRDRLGIQRAGGVLISVMGDENVQLISNPMVLTLRTLC